MTTTMYTLLKLICSLQWCFFNFLFLFHLFHVSGVRTSYKGYPLSEMEDQRKNLKMQRRISFQMLETETRLEKAGKKSWEERKYESSKVFEKSTTTFHNEKTFLKLYFSLLRIMLYLIVKAILSCTLIDKTIILYLILLDGKLGKAHN